MGGGAGGAAGNTRDLLPPHSPRSGGRSPSVCPGSTQLEGSGRPGRCRGLSSSPGGSGRQGYSAAPEGGRPPPRPGRGWDVAAGPEGSGPCPAGSGPCALCRSRLLPGFSGCPSGSAAPTCHQFHNPCHNLPPASCAPVLCRGCPRPRCRPARTGPGPRDRLDPLRCYGARYVVFSLEKQWG